jgi:hypothetical protein
MDGISARFEKERGWPKPKEPIWLRRRKGQYGYALTEVSFRQMWMKHLRRIGVIPKRFPDRTVRYGYNPHETRDLAKSLLHTRAKAEGFDMDCAEFWLGHTVDPLGYDKFYQDQEYVKKQYLIAEKHLNILSMQPPTEQVQQQQKEIEELRQRLTTLEAIYSEKLKIKE